MEIYEILKKSMEFMEIMKRRPAGNPEIHGNPWNIIKNSELNENKRDSFQLETDKGFFKSSEPGGRCASL